MLIACKCVACGMMSAAVRTDGPFSALLLPSNFADMTRRHLAGSPRPAQLPPEVEWTVTPGCHGPTLTKLWERDPWEFDSGRGADWSGAHVCYSPDEVQKSCTTLLRLAR